MSCISGNGDSGTSSTRPRALSLPFPRRWRRSAYEILTGRADPGIPAEGGATLVLLASHQVSGSVV